MPTDVDQTGYYVHVTRQ